MNLIKELEDLIKEWSSDMYDSCDFYGTDDEQRNEMWGKEEMRKECAEELKDLLEKYKNEKTSG